MRCTEKSEAKESYTRMFPILSQQKLDGTYTLEMMARQ